MRDWIANPLVRRVLAVAPTGTTAGAPAARSTRSIDEAHLSPTHILAGIERFVRERDRRLRWLEEAVAAARRGDA